MLHGYGGSLAQYYKNYGPLLKKYKIYSIDLLGMGQSSKKNIKVKNYEQTLHYFIDSIEEWRKTLGITGFVILGHSFGGYLASRYAEKYPQHVKLVFLLSPAGTTIVDENEINKSKQNIDKLPWLQQKLYNMLEAIWNNRMTPQLLYNQWYGPLLLNQYLNERFEFNDDELELIRDYSEGFLKIPEGSEKGIYQLFNMEHFPKLQAKIPIEVVFKEDIKKLKFIFLFGETDWVDSSGAYRLQEKWGKENIKVFSVPESGHQISVDNPEFTTMKLLECVENQLEK